MYVLRFPPKLAALGWPFVIAILASSMAVSASISSSSSVFLAISVLYLVPACILATFFCLIFLIKNKKSISPSGSFSTVLNLLYQTCCVSIRLTCAALYYIVNIMHYVPLVLATWSVWATPPPPGRIALFSIMPVSALLIPILIFLVNYAGLFLLGLYSGTPSPNMIAAQARSQLSTLLTHDSKLLAHVNGTGKA
jgi:hypothetical protein